MTKIVVAEDDKMISESLCAALKAKGYEVTPAYDGEQAVALAKEILPEIMLLDIMMPKLDGVSVLWELRANPATSGVAVIVLTNIGDAGTISKIFDAGAMDYLLKSDQSTVDVIQKVEDVLNRTIRLA